MALRDLRERLSSVVEEMRGIANQPQGDGGDFSEEQSKRFDELKSEMQSLERRKERQELIDDAERRMAAPSLIDRRGDGQYEQRAHEFSIVRAINAALGEPVDAGFEREISTEVRARAGRPFLGIAVPDEAFMERRVLTVGGGAGVSGEPLYPTMHRPDLWIDRLRSQLVVARLGATVLDGLVGDQEIPRQVSSSTTEHVAEDAALTPSDATFDDITLSPKTVGSITSFSRRTLINARPSIEQLVRNDLAAVMARAIDFQALFGNGQNNTPTGVANHADVETSATVGTPTWAEVLTMVAGIQSVDGDVGSLGWATHPAAVAKLRATAKVSSTDSVMLMEDPGSLAGYPLITSTAIGLLNSPADSTTMFFGAWSQLLLAYWSGVDVLVNPYDSASYLRGRVMIRAMRDYDVEVRHGESFAVASDLPI